MNQLGKDIVAIFLLLACAVPAWAAAADDICAGLSSYLSHPEGPALPNPARQPTQAEQSLIERSNVELLSATVYDMGAAVVDADNDGTDEIFAWNVDGSGRFAVVQFFDIGRNANGHPEQLLDKGSIDSGVLQSPYFVRFRDVNYLVSSDTGDLEGLNVSQIEKSQSGAYQKRTLCQMKTVVTADKRCTHPACKELQRQMSQPGANDKFLSVEWPHKYFVPAGLAAYFDDVEGDFDNTGEPASIWRIGREGYLYEYVYWHFLGIGESKPVLDEQLRIEAAKDSGQRVLPGAEHDRLRNALRSQSLILSDRLHRHIALPNRGQFFLFQANHGRTYWAWDVSQPAYGAQIHVMYTKAARSNYIGVVSSTRTSSLEACKAYCTTPLMH